MNTTTTDTRLSAHDPMVGHLQTAYAQWGPSADLWSIAKCHEEVARLTDLVHTVVGKDLSLGVSYSGLGDAPGALPYAEVALTFMAKNETDPTRPAYLPRHFRMTFGLSEIYDVDGGYQRCDEHGNESMIYVQMWDEDTDNYAEVSDYVVYERWATASADRILAHLHHYRDAAQDLARRTPEHGGDC